MCIDDVFPVISDDEITGRIIDSYICLESFNDGVLNLQKNKEHILSLVTYKYLYWEKLLKDGEKFYWLRKENVGLIIFSPNEDCGFVRTYRYNSSEENIRYNQPFDRHGWKLVESETVLMDMLDTIEYSTIFKNWKKHKEKVHKAAKEFAEGRLSNTTVEQVRIITKGNGCAVCGSYADHHASTTLSDRSTIMLCICLCEKHNIEAREYPCVLKFFGSLFFLNIDLPDLIKLDHIPDELIQPIAEVIAENLVAVFDTPQKRKNGWKIRFTMKDGWSWLLRLNKFTDYGYMLFNPARDQLHRIDSAKHHPDVPFGPSHQHFNPETKVERIAPSFTYGIPLFDFPLLEKVKSHHLAESKTTKFD